MKNIKFRFKKAKLATFMNTYPFHSNDNLAKLFMIVYSPLSHTSHTFLDRLLTLISHFAHNLIEMSLFHNEFLDRRLPNQATIFVLFQSRISIEYIKAKLTTLMNISKIIPSDIYLFHSNDNLVYMPICKASLYIGHDRLLTLIAHNEFCNRS